MANYKPSGGGLAMTFDNVRFSQTASQTLDIIPATGESDSGIIIRESGNYVDVVSISGDSGTTYQIMKPMSADKLNITATGDTVQIIGVGNSTGRYRVISSADVETRYYHRIITTLK